MSIDVGLAAAIADVRLAFGAASVVFLIVLDKLVKDPELVAWRPQPRLDLAWMTHLTSARYSELLRRFDEVYTHLHTSLAPLSQVLLNSRLRWDRRLDQCKNSS